MADQEEEATSTLRKELSSWKTMHSKLQSERDEAKLRTQQFEQKVFELEKQKVEMEEKLREAREMFEKELLAKERNLAKFSKQHDGEKDTIIHLKSQVSSGALRPKLCFSYGNLRYDFLSRSCYFLSHRPLVGYRYNTSKQRMTRSPREIGHSKINKKN